MEKEDNSIGPNGKHKNNVIEFASKRGLTFEQAIKLLLSLKCIAYDPDSDSIEPTPIGYYSNFFDKTGATTGGQVVKITENQNILIGYCGGKLIRYFQDRSTGYLQCSLDDLARVYGFEDTDEYLSQDTTLDMLNELKDKLGAWPITPIKFND